MCGIAGIFAHSPDAAPVDLDELSAIGAAMRARGPDGEGLWHDPARRIGLAHRRLAIIDPSERGAQPMVSADGGLVISFNGEIYNHRELRAQLGAASAAALRSSSDTEVILALYARDGIEMLPQLRGMFALAIWDVHQGELLLARDGLGIKPLYYANDGDTIRFASQVKALVAGGAIPQAKDPAGLVGLCLWGSVPEPYTTLLAVQQLPAGSFMRVRRDGGAERGRFFSVAETLADALPSGLDDPSAEVRAALEESVRYHLVSDVPVGAFLSSGVDSGALVGLMAALSPERLRTVTVTFDEFRGSAADEAPLAREMARLYGVEHSCRRVTRSEFEADLETILAAMDQPSIDGMNTFFVSKAMVEAGLKVAVSGLGGDELFGGYPSFRELPQWVAACRWPGKLPLVGGLARRGLSPLLTRTGWASPKLAGMLELGGSFPGAYLLRRGIFMPWELEGLLPPGLAAEGLARLEPLALVAEQLTPDPGTDAGRVCALESSCYMRNQLLRDTDWASMAHSLEVRVPLVDAQLLGRMAPLIARPTPLQGKAWMAASPRPPLPAAVLQRAKTGFATPVRQWLQDSTQLDTWRRVENLRRPSTHWSRRLAYALLDRELA